MLKKNKLNIAYAVICLFSITRPLLTIDIFNRIKVYNYSIIEQYGTIISYFMIVSLLFSIKDFDFDGINLLIILFIIYSMITFLWATDYKSGIKLLLPFSVFFCGRIAFRDGYGTSDLYKYFLISYMIPIIGSAVYIFMGISPEKLVIFRTGIIKSSGLYSFIHSMAHSMALYMFIFVLYINDLDKSYNKHKYYDYIFYILLIMSLYNIFKSGTRTVMIGIIIFLTFYLIGKKKYGYTIILFIMSVIAVLFSSYIKNLLFDIIDPLEGKAKIEGMGAGRWGRWKQELSIFFNEPLEIQMIGMGFGHQTSIFSSGSSFSATHNDLIALLTSVGYIGFFLYIAIYIKMVYDVLLFSGDYSFKMIFLGILLSVIFMNIASNSYLSRFELAQCFLFLMSIFYYRRGISINSNIINNQ